MNQATMLFRAIPALAFALAMGTPGVAHAVDADVNFNVNTTLDQIDDNVNDGVCHTSAGLCSLRAAVMQSNHINTNGRVFIRLASASYLLTLPPSGGNLESSGDLNLTTPANSSQRTFIRGVAAGSSIVDGNQLDGVMSVEPVRIVEVSDITIRNGNRQSNAPTAGGGIDNRGTLTVTHCVIESNRAVSSLGGGLVNIGTLSVVASTLRYNVGRTGAGLLSSGPATIRDSTLHGNSAVIGGAIVNNSVLYVINSTISGNAADLNGGGIANGGSIILYNTTVVDNDADHDHDENGGIGGGVYNNAGASFGLVNTLITGNTQRDTFDADDCYGTLTAYGWNLLGDVISCAIPNGAAWGFLARNTLGPLQDNGGPTFTHALLPGSRAIDTTDNDLGCIDETGGLLSDDQRGRPRVAGPRCDVGAFEFGAVVDRILASGFETL